MLKLATAVTTNMEFERSVTMEIICKLYLELATVVPLNCKTAREIKLCRLLKEARRYVADIRSRENSYDSTPSAWLLSDIDAETL